MPRPLLFLELLLIYLVLPLAYCLSPWPVPALPVLWLVSGYAWWQLTTSPTFLRNALWNAAPLPNQLASILLIFLAVASFLWVGVHRFAPQLQWTFLRQHPAFWALVMLLYPVLSVYPQAILYRAFFLHRYAPLFQPISHNQWPILLASAAAFSFLHIIFRNPLAVTLTFFGGLLFAWRYAHTGSLLTSAVEHALHGCWLFTIGLGQYFYHGARIGPR